MLTIYGTRTVIYNDQVARMGLLGGMWSCWGWVDAISRIGFWGGGDGARE